MYFGLKRFTFNRQHCFIKSFINKPYSAHIIFDSNITDELPVDDAELALSINEKIQADLHKNGSKHISKGDPEEEFVKLIKRAPFKMYFSTEIMSPML